MIVSYHSLCSLVISLFILLLLVEKSGSKFIDHSQTSVHAVEHFPSNSQNTPKTHSVGNDQQPKDPARTVKSFGGKFGLFGILGLKDPKALKILKVIGILALVLPLVIPIVIFKIALVFLKPTIFAGRELPLLASRDERLVGVGQIDTFISTSKLPAITLLENEESSKMRDAKNQCMERVACEGLFRSLPRILWRLVEQGTVTPRRKDLATLALNRLRNPQYLVRKPANTITGVDACKMYRCPTLF